MTDIAISCEGLSKQYRIGQQERYKALRDVITEGATAPFRRFAQRAKRNGQSDNGASPLAPSSSPTIWALDDVSFEVKRGEVVGIIGRNGAGKSTLLKILSRITKPTKGRAQINGRVGSLLEVGTGFHPELTGRENIYLNGAILGMRKAEIDRKFDEIVAFAEVEKFIDTPVKRYSSGMYVRLAFAVAAHMETEVLLVDEVLAVGDLDFQKKCIGSMEGIASTGKTVVVVSHNMALIESLCNTTIWLNGNLQMAGDTGDVIREYSSAFVPTTELSLLEVKRTHAATHARFSTLVMKSEVGERLSEIRMGEGLSLELGVQADRPIESPWIGIRLRDQFGRLVSHIANREYGCELPRISGSCTIRCDIRHLNLLPGRYFIDLLLADTSNSVYDELPTVAFVDVRASDVFDSGLPMSSAHGTVFFNAQWSQI